MAGANPTGKRKNRRPRLGRNQAELAAARRRARGSGSAHRVRLGEMVDAVAAKDYFHDRRALFEGFVSAHYPSVCVNTRLPSP